VSDTHTNT